MLSPPSFASRCRVVVAGSVPGTYTARYTPIAEQAEAFVRASLSDMALAGPFKDDLEKDRANSTRFVGGIEELFKKYELAGYEEAYEALSAQLATYDAFLEAEVKPRAREDFRLPADVYAFNLKGVGIDMPIGRAGQPGQGFVPRDSERDAGALDVDRRRT